MYQDMYAETPRALNLTPQTEPNISHINATMEAAIRNGDYSTALKQLDPQPRAVLDAQINFPIIRAMHPDAIDPLPSNLESEPPNID